MCLSACPGDKKVKKKLPPTPRRILSGTALRLNIGKCKAISYSRRPELNTNYSISDVTVENIENIKDLGVTFDNKLKLISI